MTEQGGALAGLRAAIDQLEERLQDEVLLTERDDARRRVAAVTDAWLQLPFRPHAPPMKAPIAAAVEWLRTHPERA